MATAETVELGLAHEPKDESINAFNQIEVELKRELQHLRHDHDKHEPEYFDAVKHLSDQQLTTFSANDLILVRVGKSAYGLHILCKLLLPETQDGAFPLMGSAGYIQFRIFVGGDEVKLHCIHTEQIDNPDGSKDFKAIFTQNDALDWFDE